MNLACWLKEEGLAEWKVKIAEPSNKCYFDVVLHRVALVLMMAQRACLFWIFPRVFSQTKCGYFCETGFGFAGKYAWGVGGWASMEVLTTPGKTSHISSFVIQQARRRITKVVWHLATYGYGGGHLL